MHLPQAFFIRDTFFLQGGFYVSNNPIMARAHITCRVNEETKKFFEGDFAKKNQVKGIGRALDVAAVKLGAKPVAKAKK